MASVRSLKKKIHQQSFKTLLFSLQYENQKINNELLMDLMEESLHFERISMQRIHASRNLTKSERRVELKSVKEQVRDKAIYFRSAIISASR